MRSGGVELASSFGAFAVRFWNVSRVISKVMFGCCLVNSSVSLSVTGKPVSSAITSVTFSLVSSVLTLVLFVSAGALPPGAQPASATAVAATSAAAERLAPRIRREPRFVIAMSTPSSWG
jgi:hypothetical protein